MDGPHFFAVAPIHSWSLGLAKKVQLRTLRSESGQSLGTS